MFDDPQQRNKYYEGQFKKAENWAEAVLGALKSNRLPGKENKAAHDFFSSTDNTTIKDWINHELRQKENQSKGVFPTYPPLKVFAIHCVDCAECSTRYQNLLTED